MHGENDICLPPVEGIIVQPTTACNLDCSYCYLPYRNKRHTMSVGVAEALAKQISQLQLATMPAHIIWHGGEPLTVGRERLAALMEPFRTLVDQGRVAHSLQTNATLINEDWCQFFADWNVHVGVSIDGPPMLNRNRLTRGGASTDEVVLRGLNALRRYGLPIHAIAVVTDPSAETARLLYRFARDNNFSSLGVNLAETEGHYKAPLVCPATASEFWLALLEVWRADPAVRVREIARVIGWVAAGRVHRSGHALNPTVDYQGNVVLLSPEFQNQEAGQYGSFVVGNVLQDALNEIIESAGAVRYVSDYLSGIRRCKAICSYFSFCGGGEASNKFFETGSINTTETVYCRNAKQGLVAAFDQFC